ncbi:unnamed protein product [Moneuplotes crassus]|uniref:Uncharacterized protein n=1 Tax=Euplotes crassus TaxID=5936 RepID=A0AAD2CZR8_EUPCR|nr:unnamed protein product [Moneuplotes crassus]
MMKSQSMNDLHHAIPQTQKYKSPKWEYEHMSEFYKSIPKPALALKTSSGTQSCKNIDVTPDRYVHYSSPRFQRRVINNLSYENDYLKTELSKVYHNEKNQFEKLNILRDSIAKNQELERQIERKKIEDMQNRRKNEDQAMKEILQRQKDEINLLKTSILEEQETRHRDDKNGWMSAIKTLEVQNKLRKNYNKRLKKTLKQIKKQEQQKRDAIETEWKYFSSMRNVFMGYPAYNPYHKRFS